MTALRCGYLVSRHGRAAVSITQRHRLLTQWWRYDYCQIASDLLLSDRMTARPKNAQVNCQVPTIWGIRRVGVTHRYA